MNFYGKETVDTNTYGKSTGHSGNYSTNYQNTGSELMNPEEIRRMDNNYAILLIRGERPIKDLKYNTFKHPNIKLTEDGGYKPYLHITPDNSKATITILANTKDIKVEKREETSAFKILIDEEIDNYLKNMDD